MGDSRRTASDTDDAGCRGGRRRCRLTLGLIVNDQPLRVDGDRPLGLQSEARRLQTAGQGGEEFAIADDRGDFQVVEVGPESAGRRQQYSGGRQGYGCFSVLGAKLARSTRPFANETWPAASVIKYGKNVGRIDGPLNARPSSRSRFGSNGSGGVPAGPEVAHRSWMRAAISEFTGRKGRTFPGIVDLQLGDRPGQLPVESSSSPFTFSSRTAPPGSGRLLPVIFNLHPPDPVAVNSRNSTTPRSGDDCGGTPDDSGTM